MTINVTLHLIDGSRYDYEMREGEEPQTAKGVADQMAQRLAEARGDESSTLQRADDEGEHRHTIIPMSSIVRIEVSDREGRAFVI